MEALTFSTQLWSSLIFNTIASSHAWTFFSPTPTVELFSTSLFLDSRTPSRSCVDCRHGHRKAVHKPRTRVNTCTPISHCKAAQRRTLSLDMIHFSMCFVSLLFSFTTLLRHLSGFMKRPYIIYPRPSMVNKACFKRSTCAAHLNIRGLKRKHSLSQTPRSCVKELLKRDN
jgi:hypothetical protein